MLAVPEGSCEGVICLFDIRKGLGIADIVKNIAAWQRAWQADCGGLEVWSFLKESLDTTGAGARKFPESVLELELAYHCRCREVFAPCSGILSITLPHFQNGDLIGMPLSTDVIFLVRKTNIWQILPGDRLITEVTSKGKGTPFLSAPLKMYSTCTYEGEGWVPVPYSSNTRNTCPHVNVIRSSTN